MGNPDTQEDGGSNDKNNTNRKKEKLKCFSLQSGSMYGGGMGMGPGIMIPGGVWAPSSMYQSKEKQPSAPSAPKQPSAPSAPKQPSAPSAPVEQSVPKQTSAPNPSKEQSTPSVPSSGQQLPPKQPDAKAPPAVENTAAAAKPVAADGAKTETQRATGAPVHVDDSVHALFVVSDSAGAKVTVKSAEKKVVMKDAGGKPVEYEADEVLLASETKVESSVFLRDIVQQVEVSHNAAIILADGNEKCPVTLGVAQGTMRAVVAALNKNGADKGVKYEAYATAAAMPTANTAKDLFAAASAEAKPVQLGSNPIIGMCLMDLEEKPLKSEADADSLLQNALKNAGDTKDPIVVHVTIKQMRKLTGAGFDVLLSALLFVFVREQDGEYLRAIHDKNEKVVPVALLKDVVGGSNRTLVVATVAGANAANETKMLSSVAKLRSVKGGSPRSGNLNRFMEFTRDHEKKCVAAIEAAKDDAEKARQERVLQKLRVMLTDGQEMMDNPEGKKPKLYSASRSSQLSGSGGETQRLNAAPAAAPSLVAGEAAGESWQTSLKVVISDEAKPADNVIVLDVNGEKKRHEVSEYVCRSKDGVVQLTAAKRMQAALANGHNTALLSAEMVPGLPLEKQATWNVVQGILVGVLNGEDTSVTNEIILYMCVVRGKQVVADLFGQSEVKPLVTAISPLFGTMVHGAVAKVVKKGAEVKPIFKNALQKAESLIKDDEFIVCTAVLKQIYKSDVRVASLFVTSASDMRPYVGVVEKDPAYPRQLFSHAFGGPCSLVLLVSYATLNSDVTKALNAHRRLAFTNARSRGGSVGRFVSSEQESVASAEEKIKKADNAKDKAHYEATLKQLQQGIADAKKLLEKPSSTQPMAYVFPAQQDGSSVDSTVRVVIVLNDKRGKGSACSVTASGQSCTSKVGNEETKMDVDEVVTRSGTAFSIRSSTVDGLVDRFIKGYNVALLTADDDGFVSGNDLLVHLSRSTFSKISPDGELFLVLFAVKPDGSAAKDLQCEKANYKPLQVASSPLLGPCVADAAVERMEMVDTLLTKIKSGISVCETDKSVLFALAIYKRQNVADKDVVLSSFLTVLAGKHIELYTNAMKAKQKERGLLEYALGGPCITALSIGLKTASDDVEAVKELGALGQKLKGTVNANVPSGGVRRFVNFSTKALAQLNSWVKTAPENEKAKLMSKSASVDRALKDAESLLQNPKDWKPKVFKQEA